MHPIPISFATRSIQLRDKSTGNVQTQASTQIDRYYATMYLHRSLASVISCRVGLHQKRNRFVSFRAETSPFQPDGDSRAKGVAFCRRWYSLYLTLHRPIPCPNIPERKLSTRLRSITRRRRSIKVDYVAIRYICGYADRINYQSG